MINIRILLKATSFFSPSLHYVWIFTSRIFLNKKNCRSGLLSLLLSELEITITIQPSYQPSLFPLTSSRETATLERSDWKSENIGLPVELRMSSRKTKHGVLFTMSPYALKAVGKDNVTLKKKMAIFKLFLLDKQDVQAVLPTGFGKCLIYHTFAPW